MNRRTKRSASQHEPQDLLPARPAATAASEARRATRATQRRPSTILQRKSLQPVDVPRLPCTEIPESPSTRLLPFPSVHQIVSDAVRAADADFVLGVPTRAGSARVELHQRPYRFHSSGPTGSHVHRQRTSLLDDARDRIHRRTACRTIADRPGSTATADHEIPGLTSRISSNAAAAPGARMPRRPPGYNAIVRPDGCTWSFQTTSTTDPSVRTAPRHRRFATLNTIMSEQSQVWLGHMRGPLQSSQDCSICRPLSSAPRSPARLSSARIIARRLAPAMSWILRQTPPRSSETSRTDRVGPSRRSMTQTDRSTQIASTGSTVDLLGDFGPLILGRWLPGTARES